MTDIPDDLDGKELHELYTVVHKRAEEHKETVANLAPAKELDEESVKVGRYRAYDDIRDEILKELDPETYEAIRGGEP